MWDAQSYNRFEKERMQPSLDLVSRLRNRKYQRIIDVGCGTGMSTRSLLQAWEYAEIIGVDLSAEMLHKAREVLPMVTFLQRDCSKSLADLGTFDLLFSNAFLQWLPNQKEFITNAFALLNENGVFAAQIPLFAEMPAYRCMEKAEKKAADLLKGIEADKYVFHEVTEYYNMMVDSTDKMEMWITDYCHEMDSPESILDFLKGTALRPHMQRLNPKALQEFLQEVLQNLEQAYPRQKNGKVLFPFKRLFLIGEK